MLTFVIIGGISNQWEEYFKHRINLYSFRNKVKPTLYRGLQDKIIFRWYHKNIRKTYGKWSFNLEPIKD